MKPVRRTDDLRFLAALDGDLDEVGLARLEQERESDPGVDGEFLGYVATVHALRSVPAPRAPAEVLPGVRDRIRRRTRGRYYGAAARLRPPWEALFNVVLLGVLAALYVTTIPPADPVPLAVTPGMFALGGNPADAGLAVLATYGEVEVVPGSASADGVTWRLTLPRERLPELRRELGLYPSAELRGPPLPAEDAAAVEVRVRIRRR